jgi:hypothetical protein
VKPNKSFLFKICMSGTLSQQCKTDKNIIKNQTQNQVSHTQNFKTALHQWTEKKLIRNLFYSCCK